MPYHKDFRGAKAFDLYSSLYGSAGAKAAANRYEELEHDFFGRYGGGEYRLPMSVVTLELKPA